jgi:hypothetical protein
MADFHALEQADALAERFSRTAYWRSMSVILSRRV